jgi:hypothetical protein
LFPKSQEKWGCLIKNSNKSMKKGRNDSKISDFSEFLMRTEPWGEGI